MAFPSTTQAQLDHVAPFFIVRDVIPAIAFYRDRLGFEVTFLGPDDGPYFAMLRRDGVRLMLKAITPDVLPTPNPSRHQWARWDAYIHTPDPDALAEEFASRASRSGSRSASTRTTCAGSRSWMGTGTSCTSGGPSSSCFRARAG
ncbi:MAG: VOC family protein [Longimicrobiaceae bacterium]